jgi:uncharacterized membrane protein HdeD (DUF308 family)
MGIVQDKLSSVLSDNWWKLLLRGLIAIAFGVLTFMQPGISLASLVLVFGAYTLVDGVLAIWTAIAGRNQIEHWVVLLLGGLCGVGIGILTFMVPGITAIVLEIYIAFWAMVVGVLGIVAGVRLRKEISGEWALILSGILAVAFGVFIIARPIAGALSILSILATFAILYGLLLSMVAFKVRGLGKTLAQA